MTKSRTTTSVRLLAVALAALATVAAAQAQTGTANGEQPTGERQAREGNGKRLATATLAGGCFWCLEHAMDEIPGVVSTTSGYTGGPEANPTYEQVSAGTTGHTESVQVVYDPATVSYDQILAAFWRNIDPLAKDRQFCDAGRQYRSAIFFHDEDQRQRALASRQSLEDAKRFQQPIVTEITAAGEFHPAEEYHQDYHSKNPIRYKVYTWNCGRAQRLAELWGKDGHAP